MIFCGNQEATKLIKELVKETDFNKEESLLGFLDKVIYNLEYDNREGKRKENQIHSQIRQHKIEEFYNFLFSLSYLEPKYGLRLGTKNVYELSPGERGSLLLIFYLLIDKEETPLLLDQPEENLDNQTVYEMIVDYIKKAKQKRQIIMVTHNPNLAVGCDAEQIIYSSIDKLNRCKVSYTSGSIENPYINDIIIRILEGTLPAFKNREYKYGLTKTLLDKLKSK